MTPPYAMPKTTAAAKKLPASRVKRYAKTIAAWRARPATRVGLAPKRSARRPQPIRPAIDARPDTPNTVAATIAATPWSIACVTMWKMGPECAAQQARCVSAIAQNCGAAVCGEPLRRGDRQRRVERAHGESDEDAEGHVELAERRDLARQYQAQAQDEAACGGAHAAADPVGERPPHERAEPHRDPVDQRDQRDGAPAPMHRVLDRLEGDGGREEGAHADGDHGGGGREDDPAVEDSALTHGRGLR